MRALLFSTISNGSSSVKVHDLPGLWKSCIHGLLHVPYTTVPCAVIHEVCCLDDFETNCILPFYSCWVKLSVSPSASSRSCLKRRQKWLCVCWRGDELMICLLILTCLLSKAAWIEETVGHNWLWQLGHDHSPRVEHLKANLHVTLSNKNNNNNLYIYIYYI